MLEVHEVVSDSPVIHMCTHSIHCHVHACTPYILSTSLHLTAPNNSTGLPPSTRPRTRSPAVCSAPSPTSSTPAPTSKGLSQCPTHPPMTVVIAVVDCTVLLVVVSLVLMVVIRVLCRRPGKKNIYEDVDANKSVRLQATQNTLQSTASYETMSLDVGPTHFNNQPHPLHTSNTTSENGDYMFGLKGVAITTNNPLCLIRWCQCRKPPADPMSHT